MKNYLFFFATMISFLSCKPKIEYFSLVPAEFCGCTDVLIQYKITGGTSGTLTTSPAVEPISSVMLDQDVRTSIRICRTTTFTLVASNKNGDVTSSGVSTLLDPIPPYTMAMVPCLFTPGGWESFTDLTHPPVTNAEIISVEFTPDRDGNLSYAGTSVPVRSGHNHITAFEGHVINNVFEFRAPLHANESCAPSTTTPDGRVRPPTLSITLNLRCRPI